MDERFELNRAVKDRNGYGSIPKEALREPLITKTDHSKYYYTPYSEEEKLVFYSYYYKVQKCIRIRVLVL